MYEYMTRPDSSLALILYRRRRFINHLLTYLLTYLLTTSKTNLKKHFCPPPYLETPKDISTVEVEKPTYANLHADRREISVSGQKIHIFPDRGLPWGIPSHAMNIFIRHF